MPVGTHAAIRGVSMADVHAVGARMVLSNAYHLYLRPGDMTVRALGGLHAFARWSGPMLTDSGGFQVFSLSKFRTVSEDGVNFKSPFDGSRHAYTPERVMQIERNLGADVIMQLDELIAGGSDEQASRSAMERSLRWLARCQTEFVRLERDGRAPLVLSSANAIASAKVSGMTSGSAARDASGVARLLEKQNTVDECQSPPQSLFPIVQGGIYPTLRRASIRGIRDMGDWHGIAVGGLSVGEAKVDLYNTLEVCEPELPRDRPRYLMGVGFPDDLIESVRRGIDLFDCVAPTKMGRHGTAFTNDGTIQISRSSFRLDQRPLDPHCPCPACTVYDRAYLRHLFVVQEPAGPKLLALHNLAFLLRLMQELRSALAAGTFASWSDAWLTRYRAKNFSE